jgi:hypothetical protein
MVEALREQAATALIDTASNIPEFRQQFARGLS